jgi:hypothetical protein
MRIKVFKVKDGRTYVSLPMLAAVLVLVPAVVIGAMELFWYKFTGGVSPLIGGFALVTSILIVIRVIGESRSAATYLSQAGLNEP